MASEHVIAPATAAGGAQRVGLMAGWGRYPLVIAEAMTRQGFEVYCLGVKGHADPALARACTAFDWIGLGKIGHACRHFVRHNVRSAVAAGKIHKHLLFQRCAVLKHLPDWRTVRTFYPHFLLKRRDLRDDTLMTTMLNMFASDGITFFPPTDFAPELLVKQGQLTRRGPSEAQLRDIEFGWRLAKAIGHLDVGQSVAVKGETALAVEAVEGTDQCIRRAGDLCKQGGFTIVKVAKPQQDMRFDVPTVGLITLQTMLEARATCLAIEAGKTILVDEREVVRFADQHGIAIVAVSLEVSSRPGSATG
ncbi:MAG TPA: UDP-2,3-diacylglucosamine diphosphatase LpxI [Pirellulales bacterium]|nr:UDP-2,3-diacylglucosamine diphosphatase LpxI [Pirellulales bacterium]